MSIDKLQNNEDDISSLLDSLKGSVFLNSKESPQTKNIDSQQYQEAVVQLKEYAKNHENSEVITEMLDELTALELGTKTSSEQIQSLSQELLNKLGITSNEVTTPGTTFDSKYSRYSSLSPKEREEKAKIGKQSADKKVIARVQKMLEALKISTNPIAQFFFKLLTLLAERDGMIIHKKEIS